MSLRTLLFLATLLLTGAPAVAQNCSMMVQPLTFQVYNASDPVHMAINTRAEVACSQGRPGAAMRLCLVTRPKPVAGGGALTFTDPGAVLNFDASGAAKATIETRAQLIGRMQGANGNRDTQPIGDYLGLALADLPGGCSPTAPAVGFASGFVTFAFSTICSAGVDAPMDFGLLDSKAVRILGQARIWALCSAGTAYQIFLYSALANARSPTQRKMTSGPNGILYGLYKDSGCLQPWGWTRDVDTVAAVGTGDRQRYTVYGCIFPKGQSVPPGTYKDTVSITIAY
ncbi:hypothetical protein SLNSH_23495 [Alsobacter soli]|uniref:Spore coat protein U/FanG domain-containing protein n=1 Tax=Alsobacter soli TaxID=2109933 RepID=A0A2T1HLL3_9HYPH|nr:spore coat U domain-containing protein [Alsobacter soli]PSC02540.1 hypothetical protein SLNSH_23495 [Alsobacter soli]